MSRRVVWVIDTSVLLEILGVPGLSSDPARFRKDFDDRIQRGELFELPLSVILETGNHIGQNGDSPTRRQVAEKFRVFVGSALSGMRPWRVMAPPTNDVLKEWIASFPEHVAQSDAKGKGCGLGDLAIVQTVARLRKTLDKTDVVVWTEDQHLARLCKQGS